MKQLVPGFLIDVADGVEPDDPDAAARRSCRSQSRDQAPVAGDVTSRSICSDQSAVPKDVQIRSCSPVSAIVTVENGASGLRRKIRATSAAGGSPSGQTLSSVMNRSAYGDSRPCRWKSSELRALARDVVDHQVEEHVVVARRCRRCPSQVPNRGSISS